MRRQAAGAVGPRWRLATRRATCCVGVDARQDCGVSRWRAVRADVLRPGRDLIRRFQRPGWTADLRGDRRCGDTAVWTGAVSGAGLGAMSTLSAVRGCVRQRNFAGRDQHLARAGVSVRQQAYPPTRQVGEPAAAGNSRGEVGTGIVQILSIRGFEDSCHGLRPRSRSACVQCFSTASRAPVNGQSLNLESRLSAVQPAMLHTPNSRISATIANATIRIASSPRFRVGSTGSLPELNDAVEIASLLELPPVRHCRSQLPTASNWCSTRRVAIRNYDREKARHR
jgi:hypothetical protein